MNTNDGQPRHPLKIYARPSAEIEMPINAATTNIALWTIVFIAWLVQSRPYHPSTTLWIGATTLLIAGSIVGEHLSSKSSPQQPALWIVYWILCGVLTAAAIHVFYDVFHGPDPLRFSFPLNCVMDSFIVVINSIVVKGCRWIIARSSK